MSLADAGFDVRVIAASFIGWADEADRSLVDSRWRIEIVRFGPKAWMRVRLSQWLWRGLAATRWRVAGGVEAAATASHPVYRALRSAAIRDRADLFIAHNLAALPAAVAAAKHWNTRAAFDAEDFHLGQLSDEERRGDAGRLVRTLESESLRRCAFVTTAAPGFADEYVKEYGIDRPTVIPNVVPLRYLPELILNEEEPGRSIFWFSQTIGPGRGIETAVRAIARSKAKPRLRLLGRCDTAMRDRITRLAKSEGVEPLIEIEAPMSPLALPGAAALSQVGLAGEEGGSVNNELAWSNKIFTYLLAGLPVLASDTVGQAHLASRHPESIRLYQRNDAEHLAARIDNVFANAPDLMSRRRAARRLAEEELNWEAWEDRWLELVSRNVGVPYRGR